MMYVISVCNLMHYFNYCKNHARIGHIPVMYRDMVCACWRINVFIQRVAVRFGINEDELNDNLIQTNVS